MAEISMGNLYDANKILMNTKDEKTQSYKFKPMNHLEIAKAQTKLEEFFNWKYI